MAGGLGSPGPHGCGQCPVFTPGAQLCQEGGDIHPPWAAHVQCHSRHCCSRQVGFVAPAGDEWSVFTAGGEGGGVATP